MLIVRKIVYRAISELVQELAREPTVDEAFERYTELCKEPFKEEFDSMLHNMKNKASGEPLFDVRICKDCQMPFGIDYGEMKFYKENGLQFPVRCKSCRKKRREGHGKV